MSAIEYATFGNTIEQMGLEGFLRVALDVAEHDAYLPDDPSRIALARHMLTALENFPKTA